MKLIKLVYLIRSTFYRYLCFFMTRNKDVLRCTINFYSKFNNKTRFGKNTHFNGCMIYGQGTVTFGDNFHSAKGLKMLTSYHNYKGEMIPYDHTLITKDIVIEDNVWVGLNVTILGGVTLGEGSIIQAGSVISKSIPPLGIAGGNPARVFSQRDEMHYYLLKSKNQIV